MIELLIALFLILLLIYLIKPKEKYGNPPGMLPAMDHDQLFRIYGHRGWATAPKDVVGSSVSASLHWTLRSA